MKYTINVLIILTSWCTYAEKREFVELHYKAKPILATTSLCLGTYLLHDAIKTTIALQNIEQQNSGKIVVFNTVIATGFIVFGTYLAKQYIASDESEKEK
jgi:hypothetical protein